VLPEIESIGDRDRWSLEGLEELKNRLAAANKAIQITITKQAIVRREKMKRVMYPEYEHYWLALLANPTGTKNENAYARRADKIPHIVLSKTLIQFFFVSCAYRMLFKNCVLENKKFLDSKSQKN
jgi:hypothetical protein